MIFVKAGHEDALTMSYDTIEKLLTAAEEKTIALPKWMRAAGYFGHLFNWGAYEYVFVRGMTRHASGKR